MIFHLSYPPLCFEIPDEWWVAAGAPDFMRSASSYRSSNYLIESERLVPLSEIAPMLRRPEVVRDHHGFRRQESTNGNGPGGMIQVLQAIVGGEHLPSVLVQAVKNQSAEGFNYVVLDGFHRFYASHALGFTHLPCKIENAQRTKVQFGDIDL